MPLENRSYKFILFTLSALVMLMGGLTYIAPGAVFPDPCWGFMVMHSMEHGGAFNLLTRPNPADLSKNVSDFLTWWSPGQYLVPYAFRILLKVTIGQSATITVTICQALGLSGLWFFFRKIGFSLVICALSLAFICCQQLFILPYLFYNGGEQLAFAFFGWFLYGCTTLNITGWRLPAFIFLAGLIGFFCKSSMMWVYIAGLAFLWIRLSIYKSIKVWLINATCLAIPSLAAIACIYYFYLSRGSNPASAPHGFKLSLEALTFPLGGPLLAGFSIDDLFNGLLFQTGKPLLDTQETIIALLVSSILSLLLIFWILKSIENLNYRILIAAVYSISVLFFAFVFLRQMDVSYEARHLRIVGILITPGVIYLIAQSRFFFRFLFCCAWIFIAYHGFSLLYIDYSNNSANGVRGGADIVQQAADQPSLNYLMALDKANRNAIFVFTSPDLALDIKFNRTVIIDPIGKDYRIDYERYVHKGHAGPLFIFLPMSYTGPKASMVLKCFPGYQGFRMNYLSPFYVLYSAYQQRDMLATDITY